MDPGRRCWLGQMTTIFNTHWHGVYRRFGSMVGILARHDMGIGRQRIQQALGGRMSFNIDWETVHGTHSTISARAERKMAALFFLLPFSFFLFLLLLFLAG